MVDEGTFEAAADELRISPSAVSQCIKALERSVGHLVVRRGAPCVPTGTGEVLLRMAPQVQVLADDTRRALGEDDGRPTAVPVAVTADSLSTWLLQVVSDAATWDDLTLELHVEDQDHSSRLLRRGDVLGAVTADPVPVAGCQVEPLGAMRYLPVAAPTLRRRFTTPAGIDWAALPELRFGANDGLQEPVLNRHGATQPPPTHTIPSADACMAAAKAGLGWAMLPERQLGTTPGRRHPRRPRRRRPRRHHTVVADLDPGHRPDQPPHRRDPTRRPPAPPPTPRARQRTTPGARLSRHRT